LTRQRAEQILLERGTVSGVVIQDLKTKTTWTTTAKHVVANVTAQNLGQLLGEQAPPGYQKRVAKLPAGSGAFVIYLGVTQAAIPPGCPPHLQFLYDPTGPIGENNSLFVSVSRPGDGRAPAGHATIIASSFTDVQAWQQPDYPQRKQTYTEQAIQHLGDYFQLTPATIVHQEAATPRSFARYTHRDLGIVGGIGQRLNTFGPFGFATRTPRRHLWLVGDSVHPGEGTAGVSYAALMVAQQIGQERQRL
jgi:C-3',4' desaturase CrtD